MKTFKSFAWIIIASLLCASAAIYYVSVVKIAEASKVVGEASYDEQWKGFIWVAGFFAFLGYLFMTIFTKNRKNQLALSIFCGGVCMVVFALLVQNFRFFPNSQIAFFRKGDGQYQLQTLQAAFLSRSYPCPAASFPAQDFKKRITILNSIGNNWGLEVNANIAFNTDSPVEVPANVSLDQLLKQQYDEIESTIQADVNDAATKVTMAEKFDVIQGIPSRVRQLKVSFWLVKQIDTSITHTSLPN